MSELILSDYDLNIDYHRVFSSKAVALIRDLLDSCQINVHSVTCRVKDRKSLARKLSKQGKIYSSLSDVTDIVGVRIVTYFENDVARVVKLIESEFVIDIENSVDKLSNLDPDRFGYVSTHHVLKLSAQRSALAEYRLFTSAVFELQTRSILQHAWAEIEHDLGYKSKREVPRHIRRKFSRLAGLLELADSEFNAISAELMEYEAKLPDSIDSHPNSVQIDRRSLLTYATNSPMVQQLDKEIAEVGNWNLVQNEELIGGHTTALLDAGLDTIGKLDALLIENAHTVVAFARVWLDPNNGFCRDDEDDESRSVYSGITFFYLVYVLLAKDGDRYRIAAYLEKFSIGTEQSNVLADRVLSAYKLAVDT